MPQLPSCIIVAYNMVTVLLDNCCCLVFTFVFTFQLFCLLVSFPTQTLFPAWQIKVMLKQDSKMAEAGPSGEHQAAGAPNDEGNAPFRVPLSVTETKATELRILLFNVSGASNAAGMPEAQIEVIKRVLNSEELALDKFSTFIFCSDKVTNPKKRVFYEIL